jgi:hypothetical protein
MGRKKGDAEVLETLKLLFLEIKSLSDVELICNGD